PKNCVSTAVVASSRTKCRSTSSSVDRFRRLTSERFCAGNSSIRNPRAPPDADDASSADQQIQPESQPLSVGRTQAQQSCNIPSRQLEHGARVAEAPKPVLPVIGTHSACADTPEWKLLGEEVHRHVIYRDCARGRARQHCVSLLRITSKVIQRKRP